MGRRTNKGPGKAPSTVAVDGFVVEAYASMADVPVMGFSPPPRPPPRPTRATRAAAAAAAKEPAAAAAAAAAVSPARRPTTGGARGPLPVCGICQSSRDQASMRQCARCPARLHLYCVNPPQSAAETAGAWLCPACAAAPKADKAGARALANVLENHADSAPAPLLARAVDAAAALTVAATRALPPASVRRSGRAGMSAGALAEETASEDSSGTDEEDDDDPDFETKAVVPRRGRARRGGEVKAATRAYSPPKLRRRTRTQPARAARARGPPAPIDDKEDALFTLARAAKAKVEKNEPVRAGVEDDGDDDDAPLAAMARRKRSREDMPARRPKKEPQTVVLTAGQPQVPTQRAAHPCGAPYAGVSSMSMQKTEAAPQTLPSGDRGALPQQAAACRARVPAEVAHARQVAQPQQQQVVYTSAYAPPPVTGQTYAGTHASQAAAYQAAYPAGRPGPVYVGASESPAAAFACSFQPGGGQPAGGQACYAAARQGVVYVATSQSPAAEFARSFPESSSQVAEQSGGQDGYPVAQQAGHYQDARALTQPTVVASSSAYAGTHPQLPPVQAVSHAQQVQQPHQAQQTVAARALASGYPTSAYPPQRGVLPDAAATRYATPPAGYTYASHAAPAAPSPAAAPGYPAVPARYTTVAATAMPETQTQAPVRYAPPQTLPRLADTDIGQWRPGGRAPAGGQAGYAYAQTPGYQYAYRVQASAAAPTPAGYANIQAASAAGYAAAPVASAAGYTTATASAPTSSAAAYAAAPYAGQYATGQTPKRPAGFAAPFAPPPAARRRVAYADPRGYAGYPQAGATQTGWREQGSYPRQQYQSQQHQTRPQTNPAGQTHLQQQTQQQHVLPSLGAPAFPGAAVDQARLTQLNQQRGVPEGGLPSVSYLLQK